jgi:ferric-dicitrate binding protein FerR (iron transport regulator)
VKDLQAEKLSGDIPTVMRQRIAAATGVDMQPVKQSQVRRLHIRRAGYAAAVILLLAGTYIYFRSPEKPRKQITKEEPARAAGNDIDPGGNNAVLTLANGSAIVLNNAANGMLAQQGNTDIVKLDSGQLAYNSQRRSHDMRTAAQYNTLTTPRGGQYQIVLPDGTKVWLNAASSIRFPTAFTGRERKVQITGECYFEVARNTVKPFIVQANNMEVDVLGTHFNIMSYSDEAAVRATLLEGSIKVVQPATHHTQLVLPGQQAEIDKAGAISIKEADMSQAIAWKNGLFLFNNDDIQTVMRQLSRWYNVDVTIQDNIPQHFTGSIHRDVEVSQVFEVLQETGSIHFEIRDGKIIVSS